MRTNRRGALVAIGLALFARVEQFIFGSQLVNTVDARLSTDLARLGARAYSEEGIPMFLACQNLAVNQTSPSGAAAGSSDLNGKVASAFQRYAEEWHQMHPDAPAADAAKIVELLADRDFASGGTERTL